jgi:hypothetical protein
MKLCATIYDALYRYDNQVYYAFVAGKYGNPDKLHLGKEKT